ncbi:HEAT repeat domain-containing protein, partial [bacterium]|nr:HEAT repeat domain-containing protein [bacterium]
MKKHIKHIILSETSSLEQLVAFEKEFSELTIGEKIYQCQSLNDQYADLDLAKIFLIYFIEEKAIKFEIKRILSWSHKTEKANFFINQLASPDTNVLVTAIELLGILGDPLAIPFLNEIFSIDDEPICQEIIKAFGRINDPFSAKTISKALKAKDPTLILKAVEVLSQWIYQVPWKTFTKLMYSKDKKIKLEAAHAISLRRPKKAVRHFLKVIRKEEDVETRYELIKISGLIPSAKLIKPLLKIITQDKDQKARLIASRSLDRLQSVLKHDDLFKLRNTSDKHIKAEIIFRLGKFGSDDDAHKIYLRKMLLKSKDQTIIQACLQALGHIADHQDLEVITQFIFKDPSSSYNALVALSKTWRQEDNDTVYLLLKEGLSSAYAAAMALTKMWRINDKSKILETVSHEAFSPTQKQIILKYLIRRRGLGLAPDELLDTIMRILEKETNINVRYLALQVLEFAPSQETLYFLISCYKKSQTTSELEVIQNNFSYYCEHYSDILF